jgi:hypothetical protein
MSETQTQEELLVEVTLSALNHWVAAGKKPANLLATENNSFVITGAIFKSIQQTGRKPTVEQVDAIVKGLGDIQTGGRLQFEQIVRQPSPQEKAEVERKEKKRKFEEAHAAGLLNSAKHNKNELDRDEQFKKPPLTEQERVAINSRNARIDEIIRETMTTIGNYSAGINHARTRSRRDELTTLFNQHRSKVKDVESAEKLQRTIFSAMDSYDRSSSGIR